MDGIIRLEKVAAVFDAWLDGGLFPFPKMRIKVLQRSSDFLAVTNVHRLERASHTPDYIAGLGDTVDIAVNDLLQRFVSDVREHRPDSGYQEIDFEWSAPEEF